MCTVTGWGAVSEGGHLANKLQKVDQFIFDVILKTEHDSPSALYEYFFSSSVDLLDLILVSQFTLALELDPGGQETTSNIFDSNSYQCQTKL